MSFRSRMTRCPRAFDPAIGAEALARLPDLGPDLSGLVAGAAGSSPYLAGLLAREAGWLPQALDDPEAAAHAVLADLDGLAHDAVPSGLRQAKRRFALLTALADLAGVWPLTEVTGHLTRLADKACDIAAKAEVARLIQRGKLPGQTEADVDVAGGLVILAMGKMGAGELNYSSDIDLICLFDEARFDPADFMEARQGFIRATRALSALLNEKSAEGYVFRTDLRLRPDPAVTPVCIAMEAAERYYESFGRTWERAAFIKARAAAGDIAAGERFLDTLTPFVWRRHLDYAAIQDAHDMRLRIREKTRSGGPLTIPGHDLKLGRGGIREIEFFAQTFQLIAGGRDPGLRQRPTCEALSALAATDWVETETADRLVTHYGFLREAEHRVQMVNDAQTHKVPGSREGLARVACLMDRDADALTDDLTARLNEVHRLTDRFFAPDARRAARPEREGATHDFDAAILGRWQTYPAMRTARARQIFDRVKPDLLHRLSRAAKPDDALLAFDGFLGGLPAGVQFFSLIDVNPSLVDLLVDIVTVSSDLAHHLARNSGVLDAVIAGSFFELWPGEAALREGLAAALARETDYERQLDAARRWRNEWHFRIGVHHLRGLIDGAEAGQQYAELASAIVAGLAPVVSAEFARKYGAPPGRGAAILGMGSLGAAQLSAGSDLDIIVIYDPEDAEMSDGRKPLAVRPYYARWTQAFITALTAPTAAGRLYEVDMRLRPSGKQGPVATSWPAFRDYQENHAWTWEHMALTRARVIAGAPSLAGDIEAFRQAIIARPTKRAAVLAEVADMRARLAGAKAPTGVLDVKTGAGRMLDIGLVASAGTLLAGAPDRDVAAGLEAGVADGWLDAADAQALGAAYRLYWSVGSAARLLSQGDLKADALGAGGAAFLCRSTGFDTVDALCAALEAAYEECGQRIDRLIGPARERERA